MKSKILFFICIGILLFSCEQEKKQDSLPSWNEGIAKANILKFVNQCTDLDNSSFVKLEDRIVVFDNDGTLWAEQPLPFQLFFAMDRIKELVKENPEWREQQPFKAIIEDDSESIANFHTKDILQIGMAANTINNVDNFDTIVNNWLHKAVHPKFNKPFNQLIYQPMLELLDYLGANDFKIYIVSGGSLEFMRAWAPQVYGIPKENIIGTTLKTEVVYEEGVPIVKRLPEMEHYDDHEGKIISIEKFIGKKPIMVVGNSDGDLEMMEYVDSREGAKFLLYLNHTDAEREYLYDENMPTGTLVKGKEVAKKRGWTLIDMKKDWNTVYPNINAKTSE